MNTAIVLLSLVLSVSAFASKNQIKVIYGEDNRKDVFESTQSAYVDLALSTAAQVASTNLTASQGGIKVTGPSMVSRGYCASERFSHQTTAANCSGFLVSDKLLVTAGHCVRTAMDCSSKKWVFDYRVENATQTEVQVPASSVYSCSRIVKTVLEGGNGDDYAVIELDRAVTDRAPLRFRREGSSIAVGADILVIGHPTGLPTKITDGAKVRSLQPKYFVANLDTYGGNSGSAVFNAASGEVEGILVRGETDFVRDWTRGCSVSNVCTDTGCRGEDVTRITNIKEIQNI